MPRKPSMLYGNESGIYAIRNCIDQRIYIGSAIQFRKRRDKHLNDLRKGKHHSLKLQRFVNKYGIETITFHILEFVPKNKLYEVEQQYLDTCLPFFNTALHTTGFRLGKTNTESHNDKISQAHKGQVFSIAHKLAISKTHHSRKEGQSAEIIQLNADGSFVKEWPYIQLVINAGFNRSAVGNCLRGKAKKSGNFKWIRKSDYNVKM